MGTLGNPTGLALDAATGRLYVADSGTLTAPIRVGRRDPRGHAWHDRHPRRRRAAGAGLRGWPQGDGPLREAARRRAGPGRGDRGGRCRQPAPAPRGAGRDHHPQLGRHRRPHGLALLDGPGATAAFNPPRGLAFGPDGNSFFATALDIQALTTAGEIRSVAGSAAKGQRDGVAAFASFADAQGIYVSPSGMIYVTDGNIVRTVRPPEERAP